VATKAYNPKNVAVILGGHVVEGYDDDTFVEIEYPDQGEMSVGADGEVVFSFSPDETAMVTITLKATSASNDALDALVKASKSTSTPISPFSMVDVNGRTVVGAVNALCVAKPTVARGRTVGSMAWRFALDNITDFLGGNSRV